jgi:hypothetical protein
MGSAARDPSKRCCGPPRMRPAERRALLVRSRRSSTHVAGPLARFSYCERISNKWLAGGALARTPRPSPSTAWWARRTTHAAMTSREK